MPVLVCVCDRENLIDPKYVELAARRAPRGEARHYDSDRFEIYHPPLVDQALADQTAFLRSISMSVHVLLRANDERFRALAQGFSAEEWSRPSLCERWSNHEVLAHLVVGLSASLRAVTGAMLRHRGSFDSANAEMARTLAAVRHRPNCSTISSG